MHLTEGKTFFFKPAQEAALYRSVVRKYVLSLPRIEADDKSVPGTALHPWVCPELGAYFFSASSFWRPPLLSMPRSQVMYMDKSSETEWFL